MGVRAAGKGRRGPWRADVPSRHRGQSHNSAVTGTSCNLVSIIIRPPPSFKHGARDKQLTELQELFLKNKYILLYARHRSTYLLVDLVSSRHSARCTFAILFIAASSIEK